ncbi:MAG TPA: OmpH family outer membrane protein [Chitinophagaceae bacterium]|nr:OmpH family outer membrane protein [Chitinophagaceae bacterium]
MKKGITAVLVAAGILFSGFAGAQTKIGYVRIDDIVSVMPELAKDKVDMDTVGQKFVSDSVMPGINYKREEYTRKLQEYSDTTKKKAVRDQILKDLQNLQEELSGADQYIQQVLQYKQQEFLRPYYERARKAIDAVAKKKGYTHVLSTDVFLVAPDTDDISLAVLEELKIKLPQNNTNKPAANK